MVLPLLFWDVSMLVLWSSLEMPWYSTIKYCIYNITTYHGTATVVAVYYGIYAVLEGTSKNTLLYVQKHITVIIILLSYCQII